MKASVVKLKNLPFITIFVEDLNQPARLIRIACDKVFYEGKEVKVEEKKPKSFNVDKIEIVEDAGVKEIEGYFVNYREVVAYLWGEKNE
jgi:hypothetical protein